LSTNIYQVVYKYDGLFEIDEALIHVHCIKAVDAGVRAEV